MSEASFSLAFLGPAVDGGEMDVRDLAPALISAGHLVESANRVLHGDHHKVQVNVRATRAACFEVDLSIVASLWEQVRDMLTGDDAAAAQKLVEYTFGGGSVVAVLAWLRGRRIRKAEPNGNAIAITTTDGATLEVPVHSYELLLDVNTRTAIAELMRPIEENDGLEAIEVRRDGKALARVAKSDAPHFHLPEVPDEIILDDVRRGAFSILSLAFKEDNKWRLHDGTNPINVTITDTDFLDRVNANEVSFSKGDILICQVRMTQRRTRDGLKTEHTVERVLEHRPAYRQLPLDFGGDE